MTTLTGHFDGKVIIPDEPVDLPANQRFTIHIEPLTEAIPDGVPGEEMIQTIRSLQFSREDVEAMERAIQEGCESIDPNGW